MTQESTIEQGIGNRVYELRTQHRYSIRGLAAKAGVSASMVSDIEKGRVEPSITTLNRLASAMGTTITYFFSAQASASGRVVRARDRVPFGGESRTAKDGRADLEARGARFELATPKELDSIWALYCRYDVGAWFGGEDYTHEGEDWGIVLTGRLKVNVGDEVYFLDPGDSIWFPSSIPHRLENVASVITEYIWVDIPKHRD